MTNENKSIFLEVQDRYNVVDVAESLGIRLHKVGSSFRANSIAGNGDGKDAFAVYENSNTWYDFMLHIGGDITDLVAHVKYNGNKSQALCELLPDCKQSHDFKREISKREEFAQNIKRLSEELLSSNKEINVEAREYLKLRGITDETIRQLQIGLDFNFSNQIRIRFPYWDMSGKNPTYYTTRAFKGSQENKYMKASLKAFPFLKNSPLGLNTVNRNNEFCIITEGMFDWLNCYQQGFAALSPNGTDFGKLWKEVTEIISKHFRYAVLAFDNDPAGTLATAKAAEVLIKAQIPFRVVQIYNVKDLAEYCEKGGQIMDLVNRSRDGLKWYIDYIKPNADFDNLTTEQKKEAMDKCRRFIRAVRRYTESADVQEVLLGLKKYFPEEWFKALCKDASRKMNEREVCDIVLEKHKLMYHSKVGFSEYTRKGIWEDMDDGSVATYINAAYGDQVSGSKITSTLKTLKTDPRVNSDKLLNSMNKESCIAFLNGTLHFDVKTGTKFFTKHSPEDYLTVRLPFFYRPEAKCPTWEKFLSDAMGGKKEHQMVLQEFAGYGYLPNCRYQKALMLRGCGANGKSIFTEVIKALYGDINGECNGYVSYAEPSKFGKDFRLMNFRTSLINISSDVENNMSGGEGVFKKLVSGETLEDSRKHKDPFAFTPRTKLIMNCNEFPSTRDTTEGFLRRWTIIRFQQRYKENDAQTDPHLVDKIMSEMPGIFNWALEGLFRLTKQEKFTQLDDQEEQILEFAKANNHLYYFLEDCFDKIEKTTHRNDIYVRYREWSEQFGVIALAANRFYSKIKAVLEAQGVKVIEQGRIWMFEGELATLKTKDPEENVNTDKESDSEEAVNAEAANPEENVNNQENDSAEVTKIVNEIKSFIEKPNDNGQVFSSALQEIIYRHLQSLKN